MELAPCRYKGSAGFLSDTNYDEEIVAANIDILSKELLVHYFGSRVTKKRLLSEKIIANKPANKEAYAPTVAGVLMFSETPNAYLPEALIRCTQFRGTEGRDIIRTEDITGTIEQQAAESLAVIERWLVADYKLEGAKLKGQLPVPPVAIREAVINALLHRKYTIPGAIKIAVYDNRIEIFSPGGFPGLVDLNNLGDGTTYLRNPILVRLAYQLKLVETRGTGIRLIYDSCKKAGITRPIYHEEGDFVKVVFYFDPDVNLFKNKQNAIMALLRSHKAVTAQQLADYLSVSRNTAIRKLNQLIVSNKIKKIGKGPAIQYVCL